mmetsp:Transcript_27957/g.58231  ORF Transcript_27957/g.58231 Transcript_27957/m.58231 type:complete len:83 (+) Transcript_27957:1185-1433(+)
MQSTIVGDIHAADTRKFPKKQESSVELSQTPSVPSTRTIVPPLIGPERGNIDFTEGDNLKKNGDRVESCRAVSDEYVNPTLA